MILNLHGVYLAYLALMLVWNVAASARAAQRTWWRGPFLALQAALTLVLVRDQLATAQASWLVHPWIAGLFPLAFVAGLCQNVAAMRERGARLSDVPLVLGNVGLGICVGVAGLALHERSSSPTQAALLYDYTVLQLLLGSRLAETATLSWHLPALCLRRSPSRVGPLLASLVVPALYAFVVLMLVLFRTPAREVIASLSTDEVPPHTARATLPATGVLLHVEVPLEGAAPPGTLDAWVLPADHDGGGLPSPSRPLVLALRPPDRWAWWAPAEEEALGVFLDGAETLARLLRPMVLLPFPEPDGEADLLAGLRLDTGRWREAYTEARRRVRAASPSTRMAVRLASTSPYSVALFEALVAEPAVVDIVGPRLRPAGAGRGGAAWADQQLKDWLQRCAVLAHPPAVWILAAGASHTAYGPSGQASFARRCLALGQRHAQVQGVLFEGWRDLGNTQGWITAQGRARAVTAVLPPP